jgi:predicted ATPase
MVAKFLRTVEMWAREQMTRAGTYTTNVPVRTHVRLIHPDTWTVTFLVGTNGGVATEVEPGMDDWTVSTWDASSDSWMASLTIRI